MKEETTEILIENIAEDAKSTKWLRVLVNAGVLLGIDTVKWLCAEFQNKISRENPSTCDLFSSG